MNYLAHFHIAKHTGTSITGALLGDFVKGHTWQKLTADWQVGILLHRKIDSFTDQQLAKMNAFTYFSTPLRRYSGIALDVYFDYLLSRHWARFSQQDKNAFIEHCYQQLQQAPLKGRPAYSIEHMCQHDWLAQYGEYKQLSHTLKAISRRLRRPVKLELMLSDIEQHEAALEECFLRLYPQVLRYAEQQVEQLIKT